MSVIVNKILVASTLHLRHSETRLAESTPTGQKVRIPAQKQHRKPAQRGGMLVLT
jgi:hypothetical protein